jgi:aryl-alcohol dehydrogenase-like predicted oxidoreductase
MDEALGAETVEAALEAGCTLIDTAPLYGDYRSEQIIGGVLAARPDLATGCTVTTKVGRLRAG